ncbi:hypothetical protein QN372_00435 [Undibacterium sp. RTI2.1]|uniref:hypothetical protein n=1 Tax=unclassified Undibacterium TaxID=2630295 RepID=UPI002AB505DF|nr:MULTISPECIES: hypothetical protein [unclassified Undibacterium]MDY7537605.1 hypothetical protein [Undibacterium sp. 5I1]MEB0029206.1 hypothetical protein [Undibacterium sp. RTI2.1]MEB0115514.1 hypothetical protein [Undibacterium sp. RTI2.2]MEB0230150.1 hypothetical protein [Undibacterium sp. 10I3]MEB0256342.1 hypothetical protein [Undibacterium sp. 5I1]
MKKIMTPGSTAVIDPNDAAVSSGIAPATDDQKKLKRLIARRHPDYEDLIKHWEFLEDTYEGGREWFKGNIFRYVKEGEGEYNDRIDRCYRFNHSREVVDLLNKYLFKQHIVRNEVDAPEAVKAFWARATKNGLSIRDFSRQVSKKTSIYGRIAVVVDNSKKDGGGSVISVADEKKLDVRTFAYTVGPEQLLDYAYDRDGELEWVLIQECVRDDQDPLESTGDETVRYRLWTKIEWRLYEERKGSGGKKQIVLADFGFHDLGVVPVILVDNMITDEDYSAPSLIDDIAYLDRAVANYLSNLDAIIQDQTFSQLAMPAQNVLPGDDNYNTLLKMGTNRIFIYDGESGAQPFFLSPDPKQAQMILAVINKIINEIYHTVGLAGERTKQDNALGIDNSSGVAKAYDFERVNALLQAKADSLELFENKLTRMVALWNGTKITESFVSYPDNFDTRGLYDEFDIAARLMLISAPDSVRQHQMEMVIDKLFPQLAKDLKDKMLSDLKSWPLDPVQLAADMAAATAPDQAALQKSQNRDTAKATLSQN